MNRRHFVLRSALAGAGTLLAPGADPRKANDQLRIAVIGLNSRGMDHVNQILKTKGARLVALCDCDDQVLRRVASKTPGKVATFHDYRKLCESRDIDAVTIATPNHTHTLIALTAALHGKHVYVEKPVSHNILEGKILGDAAAKYKVIIQHGFQRRSETSWHDAFAWTRENHLGKLRIARGFCYKRRPSIGKANPATTPPPSVNYDLWCGPAALRPPHRQKFHYDWHWQFAYGNGDLGNQGPHQLDVCRWALGDPDQLPSSVIACGDRFAYQDDGEWANTQVVLLQYEQAPILFEVRGLPSANLDPSKPMDRYRGQEVGNVIEYEGGWLVGGHSDTCLAFDAKGSLLKTFKGSRSHYQTWIDTILHNQPQPYALSARSAHLSSALAHLGNLSWRLASSLPSHRAIETFANPDAADAIQRMLAHLKANGLDPDSDGGLPLGPLLKIDRQAETVTGLDSTVADPILKGTYRKGFELPS